MSIRCRIPVYVLFGLAGAILGSDLSAQEATPIPSRQVEIEYKVTPESEPLTGVQTWYTSDRGLTWVLLGEDEDRRSPALFEAPSDGLYGLFLVLTNPTGPSSGPPIAKSSAQAWVLADETPPVVQLHDVKVLHEGGQPVAQVRWGAVDTLLPQRPITMEYQVGGRNEWQSAGNEPLVNSGQYDWPVPDDVHGSVSVRVAAHDLVGHRSVSEPRTIQIPMRKPVSISGMPANAFHETPPATPTESVPGQGTRQSEDEPVLRGSVNGKERAKQLIVEAMAHRDRGDYRQGVVCLREAVRLDPQRSDALAEMGELFYRLGDWDHALSAYELVLSRQPKLREALVGSAMAYTQKKDYSSASDRLRMVLLHYPNDVEVWMNLGDVAIYQGDESLARDCYRRASRLDPSAREVVENARKRLALITRE